MLKTTLITHIFNEEYLLPFWLTHHIPIFDEIVIIDYNSTDRSTDICKSFCPQCKIIKTRNNCFDSIEVDKEIMDIENGIQGIKMVLNTTEFLICKGVINDIFINGPTPMSYGMNTITPYSIKSYNITNYNDLISNLLNDDVVYHYDRDMWGTRKIHNFTNGNYHTGRHDTYHRSTPTNNAYIIWLGFYPMNDKLLKRKLQIQQNMSKSDKIHGRGFQHLYDRNKILDINNTKSMSGTSLKNINLDLYNIVNNIITKL